MAVFSQFHSFALCKTKLTSLRRDCFSLSRHIFITIETLFSKKPLETKNMLGHFYKENNTPLLQLCGKCNLVEMKSNSRKTLSLLIFMFQLVKVKCDKEAGCSDSLLTINESLNRLNQDDPVLIDVVRNLLIPPSESTVEYNFTIQPPKLNGQYNQVEDLQKLFQDQSGGFFIEAGAFDGEIFSNSLYFEMEKDWKGE